MGSIIPKLGLIWIAYMNSNLADALFTKTQQQVLGLLYGSTDKTFYTNEIVRLANMGRGTVKRELERMVSTGLLTIHRSGNQIHYQANKKCPIYKELTDIVKKTFGMTDVIRRALLPLAKQIDRAFIFGSVASGKESAGSDIDLMIIGDIPFSQIVAKLYDVQETLGREINPKIFTKNEWKQRLNQQDAFIIDVINKPYMDVMGENNDLGKPDW